MNTKKIHIKSNIPNITGPCLDMFFKGIRELPKCIELICDNNDLIFLPNLPNLIGLDCSNNKLILLYLNCLYVKICYVLIINTKITKFTKLY